MRRTEIVIVLHVAQVRSDYERWLDPTKKARDLLAAPADLSLVARAVNPRVNSPANDDAACIDPPEELL